MNHLAAVYQGQERHAEAGPLFKQALEIRENVFGPEHPEVAVSLASLAAWHKRKGILPTRRRFNGGPWTSTKRPSGRRMAPSPSISIAWRAS